MEKFKLFIKKETLVYLVILFVLTLIMHSDLLSNPISRFQIMYEKGNYSHPFIYSFIVYIILLIIRKTLDFIIVLFEKNPH
ncbi:MAG: hypothetical protein DRQ78_05695 [Epsilonproteobacteria bacterium]|nr:MAG: hypothetical protein DRQ78_05695 [Campylobacterota bacterium]